MSKKTLAAAVLICALFLTLSDLAKSAGPRISSDKIRDAQKLLQEKAKRYGHENVLVVFDIDHTLLTPYADLGASYWFKWQVGLIQTPEREPWQIAGSMEELGSLTTKIFCALEFRPVERQTREVYAKILEQKFPMLLLTARSPDLREPTERELKQNGFALPNPTVGGEVKKNFLVGKGHDTGDLSADEIAPAKLENPRPVSYQNGIMMVNEQDKGAMLRALLHRFGLSQKYKAIVLIDDSKGNCESLERAYGTNSAVDMTTFFYTREHPRFEAFKTGDPWPAIAQWERIKKARAFRRARKDGC